MRVLIAAATAAEVAPLTDLLNQRPLELVVRQAHHERTPLVLSPSKGERLKSYTCGNHDVDVLVTGVGMVATAAWTSRVLAEARYDFALNLGVCGSFDRGLPPGSVVHVVSDCIAELGAEDDERFLSIEDLGLPAERAIVNAAVPANAAVRRLPAVSGITVNTAHGNDRSIAAVVRRFNPAVESMEGAAFMYACQIHDVAFAQVRAVSNLVEKRNRGAWRLDEAIAALARAARDILDEP